MGQPCLLVADVRDKPRGRRVDCLCNVNVVSSRPLPYPSTCVHSIVDDGVQRAARAPRGGGGGGGGGGTVGVRRDLDGLTPELLESLLWARSNALSSAPLRFERAEFSAFNCAMVSCATCRSAVCCCLASFCLSRYLWPRSHTQFQPTNQTCGDP